MNLRETMIRKRIRNWCGGVDDDCAFCVVDGSDTCPKADGPKRITVGSQWLKWQGIPRAALEGEKECQP